MMKTKSALVIALALAALTASLLAADKKSGSAKAPSAAKGKEVFEQCAVCHSATTDARKMGPSLKGLFKKPKLANGQPLTDASVLAMVNKGKGAMPAFAEQLSDEEKNDLLAYLKSI